MELSRRSLLRSAGVLLAAPYIVRAGSLMPVKNLAPTSLVPFEFHCVSETTLLAFCRSGDGGIFVYRGLMDREGVLRWTGPVEIRGNYA